MTDTVAERAYVTAGGDFETRESPLEWFRLDVENHGKTAAFIQGYALGFATLEDLKAENSARELGPRTRFVDGLSPMGARRRYPLPIAKPPGVDVVFGAVWYLDVWGAEHCSRFILRIADKRDIPGHGLTRLVVDGVSDDYSART